MIIVNVNSQLGNQMFQYAIYRKLQLLGKDVKADLHYYLTHPEHFQLPVFGIELQAATEKECQIERDEYRTYINRLRRKIFGKRQNIVSEIASTSYDFNPQIFQLKRGYIDGYWQSEKYFEGFEQEIRDSFRFLNLNQRNKDFAERLRKQQSVSIHVRRGDYLGGFPVMDMDYFRPAMQYFIDKYGGEVQFYVFSNDIEWCRTNFIGENIEFVDWNIGSDSPYDMFLMTQCHHNIIANSSFSWWGAWLNEYPQKEVIAPKLWFNHAETPDIYCPDWIVL